MKLIHYWASMNGDKPGPWKIIEACKNVLEQVRQKGAAFLSTMAFEHEPEKGKEEPNRVGDLVIDFDCKDDPEIARKDCIQFVKYLLGHHVRPEELLYWITGSKGFHIMVPSYLFGGTEGDPLLPRIYGSMVRFITVRIGYDQPNSVDTSMYCMGKGKLLRMDNIQRPNGMYKVPITWEELSTQSYDDLIKLAREPRHIEIPPASYRLAEPLAALYRWHKEMVHRPPSNSLVNPADFILKCKFIQYCSANAETLEEPLWHAMLSVLKGLGEFGHWLSHELSSSHPEYDPDKTDKKIERIQPNMSCEKIRHLYDCGCNCGVPFPGMIWAAAKGVEAVKQTESERVSSLIEPFDFYPAEDGMTVYADIHVDDHRETYRVDSSEFKNLIGYRYYKETNKHLKTAAAQDLIQFVTARGLFGGAKKKKVFTRIAHLDDAVYIDLCDEQWRIVEITADGWRIVTSPPVRFRRVKGMLSLPEPQVGGKVDEIRKLLNIEKEDALLIEAWLLGVLSPGPYPVLILEGEQGSAKSSTTRLLRMLLDPSVAPTRAAPRNEQDLIISANNSWIVTLDNLSGVPTWLSDALCRMATGGSFSARKLFTNDEEALFTIMRPIVLNGIDQVASRHDLVDRGLRVTLPEITTERRMTESELSNAINEAVPKVLGGLCDGVVCALKNKESVQVEKSPRMADFTLWCVAAENAMPWDSGAFLEAYRSNQNESIGLALESDHVSNAIIALMSGAFGWEGTPSELLKDLENVVDERIVRLKFWPQTPASFGKRLTRCQAFLRKSGIKIDRQTGGDRIISITNEKTEPVANSHVGKSNGEVF
ncbi:hypothetical protein SYK_12070 [Pseudodesulfovibrio nedwellii]|uniref:DNA primase/polymerase bifunctional N-terminal domain-containing protein n=1 Tax=Pseudodesulfovibrio nedwellii TaxID=2973072 RepID=A0ABN6S439_9BACT|nr:hypothetical protein [Pseudodesulfovibrio nedwellii]BDQ36847.1 hypothetical protein SYK_12070 [Pseudodesulfovibrio nedwellii]